MNTPEKRDSSENTSYFDEYTFENFLTGNSNKFAYAVAHAVAKSVAEGCAKTMYNPLLIYGDPGLGKTHLLHAIKHFAVENLPHCKIILVKCDGFLDELIFAIRSGELDEFHTKYQTADILLMDDMHFIAGKNATQDKLYTLFDKLLERGKHIVLTSNVPLYQIPKLENRIIAQISGGLLAEIQPPDYTLCVAIIEKISNQLNAALPDDVTDYIAKNLNSNIRQLEGAVKLLVAHKNLVNDIITVEVAEEKLERFCSA